MRQARQRRARIRAISDSVYSGRKIQPRRQGEVMGVLRMRLIFKMLAVNRLKFYNLLLAEGRADGC
jgi:hypothetical protein